MVLELMSENWFSAQTIFIKSTLYGSIFNYSHSNISSNHNQQDPPGKEGEECGTLWLALVQLVADQNLSNCFKQHSHNISNMHREIGWTTFRNIIAENDDREVDDGENILQEKLWTLLNVLFSNLDPERNKN